MRDSDMVARAGGDKFMLLLTPVESAEALLDRCERLLQRLRDPFFVAGCEVFVSVSIGVSLCPEHACDHAALVAQADHAMQGAKRGGQGGVRLYTPELERATSERLAKEQELRAVIRDRRVCCAYQPKVDCRSGEIMGVEVLLRWIDDRGAIRPPGDILPLATSLGLIDEITPILLDETIAAIDRINAAFGETVSISFNIAAAQAGRRVFMSEIVAIIAATGFAHRFMLEVTEEAFLEKSDFHLGVLPMLREHGIGVSIDDFGTGYSSLSALSEIHADELKVDRAFITDIHRRPRSQILLKAIESLRPGAGDDGHRRGRRDGGGTRLLDGGDRDSLRPGLLLLQADAAGAGEPGDDPVRPASRRLARPRPRPADGREGPVKQHFARRAARRAKSRL